MQTSPIHKAPTLIACIPLIIGIKLSQHTVYSIDLLSDVLIVVLSLVFILQFIRTRRHSYFNLLHLLLFALSFFLMGYLRFKQVDQINEFMGVIKADFTATVLSSPVAKEKTYRVDLEIDSAFTDSSAFAIKAKTISYMEKTPEVVQLRPGERIHFQSMLNPPTGVMNPEDFDYRAFLQRKSIFATTYISQENWQKLSDENLNLWTIAARVQYTVVAALSELNYNNDELALLSALTVGYKQMIGDDQRQAYVASGATHVLAVSGLHVGIIFLFLTRLFKILGKSRKMVVLRLFIIISFLWCFAFITGLSPSVTRATLMFTLVSIGAAGRQRSSIFNTVYLSAFILLSINPHLLFDIGFQLSYCAVLGIIAFQPYFATLLVEKLRIPKFIGDLIAVSIAAQLGTCPIAIHTFNCFPNYFILTNIWVIPLVGLIVNMAIVLIILVLTGLPAAWLALPLNWLLKGMNWGAAYISQIPHALSPHLYIDTLTMVLLYVALIMFIFALDYHSKSYLLITVLCVIIAQGFHIYHQECRKEVQQLMVFNDRKAFNISTQQGFRSNILIDKECSMKMPSYFTHQFIARQTLDIHDLENRYRNYNLCAFNHFYVTPSNLHVLYEPLLSELSDSIRVTSLIINTQEPSSIYKLYEHIKFQTLVIYQRPQKHVNYYRNFCEKEGLKLHLVYEDGAYISGF